jgi:hypothetical protein
LNHLKAAQVLVLVWVWVWVWVWVLVWDLALEAVLTR